MKTLEEVLSGEDKFPAPTIKIEIGGKNIMVFRKPKTHTLCNGTGISGYRNGEVDVCTCMSPSVRQLKDITDWIQRNVDEWNAYGKELMDYRTFQTT